MKYSPFVGHSDLVQGYCDFLYNFSGIPVLMADKERIIAVSGVPREKYITRAISGEVKDLVGENRVFAGNKHVLAEEEGHFSENVVAPIVIADEIAGFVILCANANLGKEEQKLALTAAEFMGRYLSRDL